MTVEELEKVTKDMFQLVNILAERVDVLEQTIEQLKPKVN